jgi:hypothetical protein
MISSIDVVIFADEEASPSYPAANVTSTGAYFCLAKTDHATEWKLAVHTANYFRRLDQRYNRAS